MRHAFHLLKLRNTSRGIIALKAVNEVVESPEKKKKKDNHAIYIR